MFDAVAINAQIERAMAATREPRVYHAPVPESYTAMALTIRADLEYTPEPPGIYPVMADAWRRISFTMQATGKDYTRWGSSQASYSGGMRVMRGAFTVELLAYAEFTAAIGAFEATEPGSSWAYAITKNSGKALGMVRNVSSGTATWDTNVPLDPAIEEVFRRATVRACEDIIKLP